MQQVLTLLILEFGLGGGYEWQETASFIAVLTLLILEFGLGVDNEEHDEFTFNKSLNPSYTGIWSRGIPKPFYVTLW